MILDKDGLNNHERWMNEAIREAEKAYNSGEVPVGAVIITDGRVIGKGHNQVELLKDATAHAEMIAITAASTTVSSWRLENAILYTTLEPCVMCSGAIQNARISKVVYGATDSKYGACGSVYNLLQDPKTGWHVDMVPGILEDKCSAIMTSFFIKLRTNTE